VLAFPAVGVVSWVLPHVNVIDLFGLNDWVIARGESQPGGRWMAHDRLAPAAYVECFSPNVELLPDGHAVVHERPVLLSPGQVIECERGWAARVESRRKAP
jgi:hypothetical protein